MAVLGALGYSVAKKDGKQVAEKPAASRTGWNTPPPVEVTKEAIAPGANLPLHGQGGVGQQSLEGRGCGAGLFKSTSGQSYPRRAGSDLAGYGLWALRRAPSSRDS